MAGGALLYEPVLGRLLSGLRRAARELGCLRPGMVVLDVGCGTGAFLASCAAAGCRVIGVDASPEMLAEARRRLGPGARLLRADAGALPLASGAADVVSALMLLHTLRPAERGAALGEMSRVAGAGCVVVGDHGAWRPGGPALWAARGAARGIEAVAGHGAGVRSLVGGGGLAGLAAGAGLQVEACRSAGNGVLEVLRLRRGGAVA